MANQAAITRLAAKLAHIAREIAKANGDYIAQTATYAVFLSVWERSSRFDDLIKAASDQALLTNLRGELDQIPLEEMFEKYLAEGKKPSIYFFEDFIRAYDAKASKKRGVHYSPPSVVSYILNGIKQILCEDFPENASQATILDLCCGIGTFLHDIHSVGVPCKQVIGLELSEAACALAARLVQECDISNADSLQEFDLNIGDGPLVVIGNPPYSGHSANAGVISHLLADYKEGLNERNPKWLQDDYVKFIRMAQHRVEQAGSGIVAFITNHAYFSNPTFRAMRASIMSSFDKIYLLNLYGNTRTNEESDIPEENIFPIQAGVAIAFMVKTPSSPECKIMYAGITGTREEKLKKLSEMSLITTPWQNLEPLKPFSIFLPLRSELQREYQSFVSIFDLFKEHSIGFVTSRDAFAIDTDRNALLNRISKLRDSSIPPDEIRAAYPVTDLDIKKARAILLADPDWEKKTIEVLYRPFDKRWAYYSRAIMERPRLPFMENMMQENVALAIGRAGQATGSKIWDVAFITDAPTDLNLFRRGGAMLFPLYSYKNDNRQYNIVQEHDDLFYYIYAILFSQTYRDHYSEFLNIDYPRIPLPNNKALIPPLAELGKELADVHLMRDIRDGEESERPLRIGGWDIPGKYLADRRRELGNNELTTLVYIRKAVRNTYKLQDKIDSIAAQVFY